MTLAVPDKNVEQLGWLFIAHENAKWECKITLENNWTFKLNVFVPYDSAISLLSQYYKFMCISKPVMNGYSSSIYNCPKWGQSMFFTIRMDKLTMVYPYKRKALSNKKKPWKDMDEA